MSLIKWNDAYSIGFDEIDLQHRQLIKIINNLDHALECGQPDRLTWIKHETLDALTDYTVFHFSFEEQLMRQMNYPNLRAHQKAHRQMAKNLINIQMDFTRGHLPLNTQLMSIMINWLNDHVLYEDKNFGLYAAGKS